MPLAKELPDAPSPVKPNIPKIASPESKGIVVDTKYTSLASLISFTEGASWTIDFYSQILDADNDLRAQDMGQSNIYQQYTLIKGMEFKVQSPLTQSQAVEDKRTTVTGAATVLAYVIPNEGDMFAADVGDGREGIFKITSCEKKSFLKDAVYVIEYVLTYYSKIEAGRKKDLDAKVIRTLYFYKDFLTRGKNPILIEEDYNAINRLKSKFGEIAENYMRLFFNKEYNTLTVPGQPLPVYDHYLVKAVKAILTTRDAPEVKFMRGENVDSDKYMTQPQFWEALVNRNKSLLDLGNRTMGLVSAKEFAKDPLMESIAYSGIKFVVYPDKPDTSFNSAIDTRPKQLALNTVVLTVPTRPGSINEVIISPALDQLPSTVPMIAPVVPTESYVLSTAFYENKEETSLLEVFVNAYFDRKAINPSSLLKLTENYINWGGLERFYYLPIVLILIVSVIQDT